MKKKFLLTLFQTVAIILLVKIITIAINIFYAGHLMRSNAVSDMNSIINNPPLLSQIIAWSGKILEFLSYICGGFIFVSNTKNNWIRGGIVGLAWLVISYLLSIFYFLYILTIPTNTFSPSFQDAEKIKQLQLVSVTNSLTGNIPQKLTSAFIIIGLSTLGGFIAIKKLRSK